MIYDSILQTIGNTPVVRLNRMAPDNVEIYVKVESFNPMASVKDRLAFAIINDAEEAGELKPGQTVVEATSGNTGIALAMVCAATGHPFVATMADSFSVERRKIMRGLGAKVILTPAAERGSGMVKKAEELAAEHGWFLARQFENPSNPEYHASTTGPEILRDFAGRRLDFWVTGYGTGGTMSGAGRTIKAARPEVTIVATEPAGAALLKGDAWNPHKIQGWTPDFIPERGRVFLPGFRPERRWRQRSTWRKTPPTAQSSSRCFPIPVSVTCPRHFSKTSKRGPTTPGSPPSDRP
jgi:cysteine synthase A